MADVEGGARHGAEQRTGTRLEDEVYEGLLGAIYSGDLALGQKLPTENALAQRFGVSRPVVRNALSRLRDKDLIVSRQGAGSYVTNGAPSDGSGYRPLQSIKDISACFTYRRMIEGEAAALAAPRAQQGDLDELRGYIREMAALAGGRTATIELDLRFHKKIASLSDNRFLEEAISMLRPQIIFIGKFVRSLDSSGYSRGKSQMGMEHEAIVAALERGDADIARAAMTAHIDASHGRVFKGEG